MTLDLDMEWKIATFISRVLEPAVRYFGSWEEVLVTRCRDHTYVSGLSSQMVTRLERGWRCVLTGETRWILEYATPSLHIHSYLTWYKRGAALDQAMVRSLTIKQIADQSRLTVGNPIMHFLLLSRYHHSDMCCGLYRRRWSVNSRFHRVFLLFSRGVSLEEVLMSRVPYVVGKASECCRISCIISGLWSRNWETENTRYCLN